MTAQALWHRFYSGCSSITWRVKCSVSKSFRSSLGSVWCKSDVFELCMYLLKQVSRCLSWNCWRWRWTGSSRWDGTSLSSRTAGGPLLSAGGKTTGSGVNQQRPLVETLTEISWLWCRQTSAGFTQIMSCLQERQTTFCSPPPTIAFDGLRWSMFVCC